MNVGLIRANLSCARYFHSTNTQPTILANILRNINIHLILDMNNKTENKIKQRIVIKQAVKNTRFAYHTN